MATELLVDSGTPMRSSQMGGREAGLTSVPETSGTKFSDSGEDSVMDSVRIINRAPVLTGVFDYRHAAHRGTSVT